MSRHLYLDASPPPYTGSRNQLDRSVFHKHLSCLGARVAPERTRVLLKSEVLKNFVMDLPKIKTVVPDPEHPDGDRLVLLRVSEKCMSQSLIAYSWSKETFESTVNFI